MEPDKRRSHRRKSGKTGRRIPVSSAKKRAKRPSSAPRSISSSFVMPRASRGTIQVNVGKKQKPEGIAFLLGMVGCLVLLWSGPHYGPATLGFALLMSGLALILTPPAQGLGRGLNWCILGVIVASLFAFIPPFYWKTPEWRRMAVEELGIALPALLTVQPRISFEGVLLLLAGVAWLYSAAGWKLNHQGRGYLYLALSTCTAIYCGKLIFDSNAKVYRGQGDALYELTLLSNADLYLVFLGISGAISFAYGIEGLAARKATHLLGLIAATMVYGILVVNGALFGLVAFLLGLALVFILRLWRGDNTPFYKVSYPLLWAILLVGGMRSSQLVDRYEQVSALLQSATDQVALPVYRDVFSMVVESPVFGVGLGNVPAILPQYRDATEASVVVSQVGSEWLRILAEGGLFLFLMSGGFVLLVLRMSLQKETGFNAAYRAIAMVSCILLFLSMLVAEPLKQPGIAFLSLLFLVWALPRKRESSALFRPLIWRTFGGILTLFGIIWLCSGWFGAPGYSSVKAVAYKSDFETALSNNSFSKAEVANDKLISLQRLNWNAYFDRGVLNLAQLGQLGFDEVSADFDRARFCEPTLGAVTLAIGNIWLEYDARRTVTAWRETFQRSINDKKGIFAGMLAQADENYRVMLLMDEVASLDSSYKAQFIDSLSGSALMREINKELAVDPRLAQFSKADRTKIVFRWIVSGDVGPAESFLRKEESQLDNPWILWSLIRKSQANFEEAVALIRENCPVPEIPSLPDDFDLSLGYAKMERSFLVSSRDKTKAAILIQIYLSKDDYANALRIIEMLQEEEDSPEYADFWRAELLHRLGDDIESWYAFESYLNLDQ